MASKPSRRGKQSVSFRFRPDHRLAPSGQTALAERYIEEGIRQDEHPLIYFREGAAGRRPACLALALDIAEAIETIRQNDGSVEEAASYLEIPVEQLEAAARYCGEYTVEVDELVERSRVARTLVTNDVLDFQLIHNQMLVAGEDHHSLIFTSDSTMPPQQCNRAWQRDRTRSYRDRVPVCRGPR
jgi:hypothetical protein